MKARHSFFTAAAVGLGLTFAVAGQQPEPTTPNRIVVNIDTQKTADPVSNYEFGMFIEHIGPLIYRSLWSEMLDDRKFYFPISSAKAEPATPPPTGPSRQLRRWVPVGPDNVVQPDKNQPFVGDQSPREGVSHLGQRRR
jgi:alpha-L-arabinofuranosidase